MKQTNDLGTQLKGTGHEWSPINTTPKGTFTI